MDKLQIEKAAKEYDHRNRSNEPEGADNEDYIGFKAGAAMVNEKQPYTAEDMLSLTMFIFKHIVCIDKSQEVDYFIYREKETSDYEWLTFDKLLKLWEESKNG